MSNVVTPEAFATFPAPYRIQVVYDRLKAALSHLPDVEVTMEPLVMKDSADRYPHLQYDTCRVWARRGTLSANIHGVIQDEHFFYRVVISKEGTPDQVGNARMTELDDLIVRTQEAF